MGGSADIIHEAAFAFPFKTLADTLIATDPILFLRMLQIAVLFPRTPPMLPDIQELSNQFNALFANTTAHRSAFASGARAAHATIVNDYLNHTGPINWITYTNIGIWGPDEYIQRSSITQFIQHANNHEAAAYYHTFKDGNGLPLNGTDPDGYVLTFPADQTPTADRFWSLTAYTPEAIELVPNPANKYLVASYTPLLLPNQDGSISIYMARQLPPGVNMANWLPVPPGPFSIMLRVYGPEGGVKITPMCLRRLQRFVKSCGCSKKSLKTEFCSRFHNRWSVYLTITLFFMDGAKRTTGSAPTLPAQCQDGYV